jgi:preprotein translocase subunit SecF
MILTPQNMLMLATGLLLVIGLCFLILNIRLLVIGRRFQRLMKGTGGVNLEQLLEETLETCQEIRKRLSRLEDGTSSLVADQAASLQGVGFTRFNAYSEMGNMSFALALLNKNGDGVVFCCLANRDDCRLYARQVVGGVSTTPLSNEEKEAIRQAMDNK